MSEATQKQPPRGVGWWPEWPRSAPGEAPGTLAGEEHVFPSGRAAIVACLVASGVGPRTLVATPDCVTDCVPHAVRRRASPISLAGAAAHGFVGLGAAIIHEQWGWPLADAAWADLATRLAGVPLVVDRVDSADFFCRLSPRLDDRAVFEVLSLSKVLGLDAGGLARHGSSYLRAEPAESPPPAAIGRTPDPHHPAIRTWFKQSDRLHPAVAAWLNGNSITAGVQAELAVRQAHLALLLDSALSEDWPEWLRQAAVRGAGPVWAPVLRGAPLDRQWQAAARLAELGVAATVRPFNWTGNPLAPHYAACVSLPIHGALADHDLPGIVHALLRPPGSSI